MHAHGRVHLLDRGLDHGLLVQLVLQPLAERVGQPDLLRPALAQRRALARRARRDRGAQQQRALDEALVQRRGARVRVQLEQPGQVVVGRGGWRARSCGRAAPAGRARPGRRPGRRRGPRTSRHRPGAAARWPGTRRSSRRRCRGSGGAPPGACRARRPARPCGSCSPPAGANEIAQAAVLSASESATATASMRSSGPSCGEVLAEARVQLLDGVANPLLGGAPHRAALRARRHVGGRASRR